MNATPPPRRAVSTLPPCIVCATTTHVKCKGGGSVGKYRYECMDCDIKWQQVPPHLASNSTPRDMGIVKSKRILNTYRCSVCRQIKRGHVCTGFDL